MAQSLSGNAEYTDSSEAEEDISDDESNASLDRCIICERNVPDDQFPPNPSALYQDHDSCPREEVCLRCWRTHLRIEIETKTTVCCPQCPQVLKAENIRGLAATKDYLK